MAGVSSDKRKCTSHDIDFDGALLSSTRASLVIELIKYLLYERQQIPLPLDQLSFFLNNNVKTGESSENQKALAEVQTDLSKLSVLTESSSENMSSNMKADLLLDLDLEQNLGLDLMEFKRNGLNRSSSDYQQLEQARLNHHDHVFPKLIKETRIKHGYHQNQAHKNINFFKGNEQNEYAKEATNGTDSEYISKDFERRMQEVSTEKLAKYEIKDGCQQVHTKSQIWTAETNCNLKMLSKLDITKAPLTKNSTIKKTKSLIQDLTQTFDNLKKAFEVCPEIEQVAVLLGGTVVSPKESYFINFPPPCPDADCLPLVVCKTTLFKQIISEDIFGVLTNTISPTNIMLLFSAPRTCPLQWFLPKMSFAAPRIGTVITLNFHCTYLVPTCHDLTLMDAEMELSGIELLDCSLCEKDASGAEKEPTSHKNGDDAEKDDTKKNNCEFVIHSKHKDFSRNVVNGDTTSHPQSVDTTPCISRFCVHQKLNYIYSHHKRRERANQKYSHDAIGCILNDSPTQCQSINIPAEKDLLWYQSPLIIKGFNLH
ncbi:uncharacterized protein LOC106057798 isoform X1 [Biomphalaria glabrata]|uniref:Uncharacterized protein LOC106057798 isoform X1 n=1 Tax=Biomphalaria glabrata TaxID=6526 RepID=A0A9W2ZWY6_BIOGL|nr:uncharacterized protein LOC106057798 isoform X1 [Biomphalaria glabrata]